MRFQLTALALLIAVAPAAAQTAPAQPPQEMQRALNDPAMIDRLTHAMEALSDAFMNLPVGEVQAAVEGRQPTAREKKLRVGDVAGGEVDVRRQIAEARPMIRQSMKALSEALPAMMKGLDDAQKALDRAAANMPDPTYPRR